MHLRTEKTRWSRIEVVAPDNPLDLIILSRMVEIECANREFSDPLDGDSVGMRVEATGPCNIRGEVPIRFARPLPLDLEQSITHRAVIKGFARYELESGSIDPEAPFSWDTAILTLQLGHRDPDPEFQDHW